VARTTDQRRRRELSSPLRRSSPISSCAGAGPQVTLTHTGGEGIQFRVWPELHWGVGWQI